MKTIKLTKGYETIVDDEDYEFLTQWKWHAKVIGRTVYARRSVTLSTKNINGRFIHSNIYMHRLINQTPANLITDHKDGNGLNNRKENIRSATILQNNRNKAPYKGGTSKYKGVNLESNGKWRARIKIEGQSFDLGYFTDELEASNAYEERAKKVFGEFYWENTL